MEIYIYYNAFLSGSGYFVTYKAYIHYVPWVLGQDVPPRNLFTTSGGLMKIQNMPKISTNLDIHLPGCYFGLICVSIYLCSLNSLYTLSF